jgi:hypothetical protein
MPSPSRSPVQGGILRSGTLKDEESQFSLEKKRKRNGSEYLKLVLRHSRDLEKIVESDLTSLDLFDFKDRRKRSSVNSKTMDDHTNSEFCPYVLAKNISDPSSNCFETSKRSSTKMSFRR